MKRNWAWILVILLSLTICLTGCGAKENDSQGAEEFPLYKYDINAGRVMCSADGIGAVADGTDVTVSAQAHEGYSFVCWTKGAYLEDYGEIVSDNPEYTFVKNGKIRYYANFVRDGQIYVCYFANGGTIHNANAQNDCLIQKVTLQKHKYPVTFPQNGTFSRDGYVLKEYTSEMDGSGTVTNIGQRVFSDKKLICLYAQWSKETDSSAFIFEARGGGLYITGYTGNDEVLTIPAQHEGKNVVGIESNAINTANVKTLILPETVTTIENSAFAGCSSLNTVYLYDTVTEMADESFSGCPVKTVCLNSVYDMKYYAEGAGKLELLYSQENADIDRLIVISGSSGIYGLDSAVLQSELTKELNVVNFALQISIPSSFSMRIIKDYLHPGDNILLAPECEFKQFDNMLTTIAFQKFDGAFTSMRSVDISEYTSFFNALSMYSLAKANDEEHLVAENDQFYSSNGDSGNSREYQAFPATYTFKDPTKREEMTAEVYARINAVIDLLKDNGIEVYLSFAPFCSEACAEEVTADMLSAYSESLAENLHVTCISSQADHDYAMNYFFEMFHMTSEGRQLRTTQLAKDLNGHFAQ